MKLRRIVFWIHLALGIVTGLIGGLMAGTGVIMAFADSYVDFRDGELRRVDASSGNSPKSLSELLTLERAEHPDAVITRIGVERDLRHAVEFYSDPQKLDYVDPRTGAIRLSDSVPLRRTLHKGVEQWHRFLGLSGDSRPIGKGVVSWTNVLLIPLFLTGLVLWWPAAFRWRTIRAALLPGTASRRLGTQRSWHSTLGFWVSAFLLIMVVTATTHSFEPVRNTVTRIFGNEPKQAGAHDSLWAPGLGIRPIPDNTARLNLDQLRAIADKELPGWSRLDIFPAAPGADHQTATTTLSAKVPGRGPAFYPVSVQVHPYTGEVLDVHSWDDLSGGTRALAWARWLHKGEAFGRPGQIIAGLACLAMLVLIFTGWALAIRRLVRFRSNRGSAAT